MNKQHFIWFWTLGIAASMLMTIAVQGQTLTISGHVQDESGVALSNVQVRAECIAVSSAPLGLLTNGDFETGDLTGWQVLGGGAWIINDGFVDPQGPDNPWAPCSGDAEALANTGGDDIVLYQEVTLPASGPLTLHWTDRIRNHADRFEAGVQEFRVEVWDTYDQVLETLWSTQPGDVLLADCVERSADISAHAGQTVRLAFIEHDELYYFNVHLDDVFISGGQTGPAAWSDNFETGDLAGWQTTTTGNGEWMVNDGTVDPASPDDPMAACAGSLGVFSNTWGPGTRVLYRDIAVPAPTEGSLTLRWIDRIRNHANRFEAGVQEFRVEIRDTNDQVLETLWSTQPGDTLLADCVTRTADISAYAGQTIRLAFVEHNELYYLNVHLDDVQITVDAGGDCAGDTTLTDGNGDYTLTVSSDWAGTVAASDQVLWFDPLRYEFSNIQTNQLDVDFVGYMPPTDVVFVRRSAVGTGDGSSWANAFKYLQDALDYAEQMGIGQIWVAAGTYRPDQMTGVPTGYREMTFQLRNGIELYGGFPAEGGSWSSRDPQVHQTILDGDLMGNDQPTSVRNLLDGQGRNDNSFHIVSAEDVDSTAVLDGFVIRNGQANDWPDDDDGAGLYCRDSSPTIRNCTFERCAAEANGGAIYLEFTSPNGGPITLEGCTLRNCASDSRGAALHCTGRAATLNMINCVVENCYAGYSPTVVFDGRHDVGSTFTAAYCLFHTPPYAGGALLEIQTETFALDHCTLIGAYCDAVDLRLESAGQAEIANCIVWTDGSSIRCYDGILAIESSIVREGIGGIYMSNGTLQWGSGNSDQDPLLTADGHLTAASPALDNATGDASGALDRDGELLPSSGVDIGCDEFVDSDSDGLPDYWELLYYASKTAADPNADDDGDGMINRDEYEQYGTNPWSALAILVSPLSLTVPEGEYRNFYVQLSEAPTEPVSIPLTRTGDTHLDLNKTELLFTATDYDNSQAVRVTAEHDLDAGDGQAICRLYADGLAPVTVNLFEQDDESFLITGAPLFITEGYSDTFWVALTADPCGTLNANVTVTQGAGEVSLSTASLQFTSADYDIAQPVVVTTLIDGDYEDEDVIIEISAPSYPSVAVPVNITDPDIPPSRLYVDGSAQGSNSGTNWTNAMNDLGQALSVAAGFPDIVDEVYIAEGMYRGVFGIQSAVSIYGGFPTGGSDWAQRDPCAYPTILSADLLGNDAPVVQTADLMEYDPLRGENGYQVIVMDSLYALPFESIVLDGLTIRDAAGGAGLEIYPSGASYNLTVRQCRFELNGGGFQGGGVNLEHMAYEQTIQLTDCIFHRNAALIGGGLWLQGEGSGPQASCTLDNCRFEDNYAQIEGGGAFFQQVEGLTLKDCVFESNSAVDFNADFFWYGDNVVLQDSVFAFTGASFITSSAETVVEFRGSNPLDLSAMGPMTVTGQFIIGDSVKLTGGDVTVEPGCELTLADMAELDLGVGNQLTCHGILRAQDHATITNTNLSVERLQFLGEVAIWNNVITAESGSPFGEFVIEDSVTVYDNNIYADGDRFLDLDPSVFDGLIGNNRIYVTITEGKGQARGGLLELRGQDFLGGACGEDLLCQVTTEQMPDFDPCTWTLEQLLIEPDAKVNLTNRFDFQPPYDTGGEDEVLYVRHLELGAGSVLNLAFNRIYYETATIDPNAIIKSEPLLGFSLNNITFDDDIEFLNRVRRNNAQYREDTEYDRPHVTRVVGVAPDAAGMMRLKNLTDIDPNSPTYEALINARAHGVFARSDEPEILVLFEYLFETAATDTELVVSLTDSDTLLDKTDPQYAAQYLEVARIAPPPAGRPGAVGSERFGVFSLTVSPEHLNFRDGTRIEFELVGPAGASVLINNWDPQVHCSSLYCKDVTGDKQVTPSDFLTIVGEYGASSAPTPDPAQPLRTCLDGFFAGDGYIDINDLLDWDWFMLSKDQLNLCGVPLALSGQLAPDPAIATASTPTGIDPAANWLIATKQLLPAAPYLQDYLYGFDHTGGFHGATAAQRPNLGGRLMTGPDGTVYQVNLEAGIVAVDEPNTVIAPSGQLTIAAEPRHGMGAEVVLGLNQAGSDWFGRPILDAAFDAAGDLYVTPVVVDPNESPAADDPTLTYLATARLHLTGGPAPGYEIVQLYDDPCYSPNDNQQRNALRELEVDADGNVYILNAHYLNESDTLWKYAPNGALLALRNLNLDLEISAPVALHVTADDQWLCLASADNAPDANDVVLHVLSKDLTLDRTVLLEGMGHVTAIASVPYTSQVAVAGFGMANIPEYPNPDDPAFYRPRWATLDIATATSATCVDLAAAAPDLAIPFSVAYIGSRPCNPADLDADGVLTIADLAELASYWLESNCTGFSDCARANLDTQDQAQQVNLADWAAFIDYYQAGCALP